MTDDQQPAFPQYSPPNPNGIPLLSHPKQQAPLMKMIKNMIKPRLKTKMRGPKTKTWKQKKRFY